MTIMPSRCSPVPHSPGIYSPPALVDHDRALVTISGGNELRRWDLATGKPVAEPVRVKPYALQKVVASPDGNWFATGGNYGLELHATNAERSPVYLRHVNLVTDLAFSPDSTMLVSASRDGTARLWSVKDGEPIGAPMAHIGGVTHAAWSNDLEHVVTAQEDGLVRVWQRPRNDLVVATMAHWGDSPRISFDGRLAAPAAGSSHREEKSPTSRLSGFKWRSCPVENRLGRRFPFPALWWIRASAATTGRWPPRSCSERRVNSASGTRRRHSRLACRSRCRRCRLRLPHDRRQRSWRCSVRTATCSSATAERGRPFARFTTKAGWRPRGVGPRCATHPTARRSRVTATSTTRSTCATPTPANSVSSVAANPARKRPVPRFLLFCR